MTTLHLMIGLCVIFYLLGMYMFQLIAAFVDALAIPGVGLQALWSELALGIRLVILILWPIVIVWTIVISFNNR